MNGTSRFWLNTLIDSRSKDEAVVMYTYGVPHSEQPARPLRTTAGPRDKTLLTSSHAWILQEEFLESSAEGLPADIVRPGMAHSTVLWRGARVFPPGTGGMSGGFSLRVGRPAFRSLSQISSSSAESVPGNL